MDMYVCLVVRSDTCTACGAASCTCARLQLRPLTDSSNLTDLDLYLDISPYAVDALNVLSTVKSLKELSLVLAIPDAWTVALPTGQCRLPKLEVLMLYSNLHGHADVVLPAKVSLLVNLDQAGFSSMQLSQPEFDRPHAPDGADLERHLRPASGLGQ